MVHLAALAPRNPRSHTDTTTFTSFNSAQFESYSLTIDSHTPCVGNPHRLIHLFTQVSIRIFTYSPVYPCSPTYPRTIPQIRLYVCTFVSGHESTHSPTCRVVHSHMHPRVWTCIHTFTHVAMFTLVPRPRADSFTHVSGYTSTHGAYRRCGKVDNAPAWLGLAGLALPDTMDGRSYVPLLVDPTAVNVPAGASTSLSFRRAPSSFKPTTLRGFHDDWHP
jgi:hypothetical protein